MHAARHATALWVKHICFDSSLVEIPDYLHVLTLVPHDCESYATSLQALHPDDSSRACCEGGHPTSYPIISCISIYYLNVSLIAVKENASCWTAAPIEAAAVVGCKVQVQKGNVTGICTDVKVTPASPKTPEKVQYEVEATPCIAMGTLLSD